MKKRNIFKLVFIIILSWSYFIGQAQSFYILGGGTYGWIKNYNDDKGSEYFNESNYAGYRGFYHYTFGIGYEMSRKMTSHVIECKYLKIGGIGKYKNWERPEFGEVHPGLIVGTPDYQEQGFFATTVSLKYLYRKAVIGKKIYITTGVSYNYILNYKIYNYLSSSKPPYGEMRGLNSYIREKKYLNRHNLSFGLGLEYKFSNLISVTCTYDKYILAVNRKIDHIMIRRYYPNILTMMLKIYYK